MCFVVSFARPLFHELFRLFVRSFCSCVVMSAWMSFFRFVVMSLFLVSVGLCRFVCLYFVRYVVTLSVVLSLFDYIGMSFFISVLIC